MSDRTITLPAAHVAQLRGGKHAWWDDSDGREVLVVPEGYLYPGEVYDGAIVVTFSPQRVPEIDGPGGLPAFDSTGDSYAIRAEGAR